MTFSPVVLSCTRLLSGGVRFEGRVRLFPPRAGACHLGCRGSFIDACSSARAGVYGLHRPARPVPAVLPHGGGGWAEGLRTFRGYGPETAYGTREPPPRDDDTCTAAVFHLYACDERCFAHYIRTFCGADFTGHRPHGPAHSCHRASDRCREPWQHGDARWQPAESIHIREILRADRGFLCGCAAHSGGEPCASHTGCSVWSRCVSCCSSCVCWRSCASCITGLLLWWCF